MKTRMNINQAEPAIYKAMAVADNYLPEFQLDRKLQELIRIRVSQINGCGYCIDYHSNDALQLGETPQRLFALAAWWETPFFNDEERAILKLAEEVTNISQHGVSDNTYENALQLLGEQKLAQVIFVTITINNWNRIAISMHMVAGE
ncbi:alkylhydroperoxidase AhpD family core domain-containing protein [Chitinophaga sp. YR573]|uniref:carboxymuconolactone decarboxylase family protein n=1 Tax=Chitinophaga sp. YR573 TaxID=1881040 RepID=UPI0008C504A9|nr:carboxymuconolactone decarboxylase family protein [Chitinophaga sp. YR573]SEW07004.1 alkylhydroperoxidase AhpD family core domain-containing protein [Chitinophaga sp. YR573]